MTLYLMSTTIIPAGADGCWTSRSITLDDASSIVKCYEGSPSLVSAVGHQSTAEIMATLLEAPLEANRITVQPRVGDRFLCFKLEKRPPEGVILDREALEELGYGWVIMTYLSAQVPEFAPEKLEEELRRVNRYRVEEREALQKKIRILRGEEEAPEPEPWSYQRALTEPRTRGGTWGGGHMD